MSYRITPKYQAVVSFFVLLSVFSTLFSIPKYSANADYAWTEQAESPQLSWKQVAMSSDASIIYAISSNADSIYTSTTSGATWAPLSAGIKKWTGIATTPSGSTVVAVADGDVVYRSDDTGATWNAIPWLSSIDWSSIAISADGQKIIVTAWTHGEVAVTTDGGSVWSNGMIPGSNLSAVTGSADLSKIAIAAYGGSILTSTNGSEYAAGTNEDLPNANAGCWSYMGSALDAYVVAVGDCKDKNGYVYTTHNFGASWNNHGGSSGTGNWYSVQISSKNNNQTMVAVDHDGYIKISNDEGVTWQEQTSLGKKGWTYATVSEDGSKFVAVAGDGSTSKVYTGSFFTPPTVINAPAVATSTPSDVGTSTITLNATVVSDGGASTTESGFNWGETLAYGNTASSSITYGAGSIFSHALSGLTCALTYHYQAYALNSAGTATSSDDIFTMSACDAVSTSTNPGTTTDQVGTTTDSTPTTADDEAGTSSSRQSGTRHQIAISGVPTSQGDSSSNSGSNSGSNGGDTTNSCALRGNLRPGSQGTEVTKLQNMLNKLVGATIAVNDVYGPTTKDVVKVFQNKYASEILAPWGVTEATGIVSFTTLKKLNELSCGQTFALSPIELYLINQYKNNPTPMTPEGTATATSSDGTVIPVEVGATTPGANDTQPASVINSGVTGGLFQKIGNFFKKIF